MTLEDQTQLDHLKRVADALERIANALELANFQEAFPPQPQTYVIPSYPTTPNHPGTSPFTYTNVSDVSPVTQAP